MNGSSADGWKHRGDIRLGVHGGKNVKKVRLKSGQVPRICTRSLLREAGCTRAGEDRTSGKRSLEHLSKCREGAPSTAKRSQGADILAEISHELLERIAADPHCLLILAPEVRLGRELHRYKGQGTLSMQGCLSIATPNSSTVGKRTCPCRLPQRTYLEVGIAELDSALAHAILRENIGGVDSV